MKNNINIHIPLSDRPRNNAFAVPDSYFEELPAAVLSKCSVSKVKPLSVAKPLWWSVAACGILLWGIWFVAPKSTSTSDFLLADEYAISELQDYLACHVPTVVIEEGLYNPNMDASLFQDEITDEDLLAYVDTYWDYNDFN